MQLIVLFYLPTMTYIIVFLNFLAAWKTAGISRGFSKWNSPFKLTALSSFLLASCLKMANLTAKNHHYRCAGGEKSLVEGTLHGTLERDTQFHLPWQVCWVNSGMSRTDKFLEAATCLVMQISTHGTRGQELIEGICCADVLNCRLTSHTNIHPNFGMHRPLK